MSDPHSRGGDSAKTLRNRLDRWAGELNAFLILFAVGLAVMDGTCFLAMQMRNLPISRYFQIQQPTGAATPDNPH